MLAFIGKLLFLWHVIIYVTPRLLPDKERGTQHQKPLTSKMSNGCHHWCSDLLQNLWVMVYGCYFGTLHPPKDCCIPSNGTLWQYPPPAAYLPQTPPPRVSERGREWLECKVVWVVSRTRKALNKCSPFTIFPASKFPKSWSDGEASSCKQIKQMPKWFWWHHNIRLVVLLLWLIGAVYAKIITLQTAVHIESVQCLGWLKSWLEVWLLVFKCEYTLGCFKVFLLFCPLPSSGSLGLVSDYI